MSNKTTEPNDFATPKVVGSMGGLTKRELFAAMAMQGYCGNPEILQSSQKIARWAVQQADELIKELNK